MRLRAEESEGAKIANTTLKAQQTALTRSENDGDEENENGQLGPQRAARLLSQSRWIEV